MTKYPTRHGKNQKNLDLCTKKAMIISRATDCAWSVAQMRRYVLNKRRLEHGDKRVRPEDDHF